MFHLLRTPSDAVMPQNLFNLLNQKKRKKERGFAAAEVFLLCLRKQQVCAVGGAVGPVSV